MNQPTYCLMTEIFYTASRTGRESVDPVDRGGGKVALVGRGRRTARRPDRSARADTRGKRSEFRYARAGCRG